MTGCEGEEGQEEEGVVTTSVNGAVMDGDVMSGDQEDGVAEGVVEEDVVDRECDVSETLHVRVSSINPGYICEVEIFRGED
jgi:hypothetical protein